jgi:hypothetical protein
VCELNQNEQKSPVFDGRFFDLYCDFTARREKKQARQGAPERHADGVFPYAEVGREELRGIAQLFFRDTRVPSSVAAGCFDEGMKKINLQEE